jgi:two-component system chemotaxis response regulator CheY
MRSLVVEDEFTSRMQLLYFLKGFGDCDVALDGIEAIKAFLQSSTQGNPYTLICLDIKLPGKTGHQVLEEIRNYEEEMNVPFQNMAVIFMTTAMTDAENIRDAVHGLCNEYLTKPIDKEILMEKLREHKLIK